MCQFKTPPKHLTIMTIVDNNNNNNCRERKSGVICSLTHQSNHGEYDNGNVLFFLL